MARLGSQMDHARRDYAILISLSMREEAEVLASALRAEGIDAFVGNRHHANVDWGWTIALGGMQVFVPADRLAEAKDIIRARLKDAADTPDPEAEPTKRHDRWKAWAVIAGYFGLVGYVQWLNSYAADHVYYAPVSSASAWSPPVGGNRDQVEAILLDFCADYPYERVTVPGDPDRIVACRDLHLWGIQPSIR